MKGREVKCGGKLKASEKIPNKDHAKTDEEEMDNGPKKLQLKPIPRKWKLRARVQKMEKGGSSEPKSTKRPSTEILRPIPENKKKRLLSPLNNSATNISSASLQKIAS